MTTNEWVVGHMVLASDTSDIGVGKLIPVSHSIRYANLKGKEEWIWSPEQGEEEAHCCQDKGIGRLYLGKGLWNLYAYIQYAFLYTFNVISFIAHLA